MIRNPIRWPNGARCAAVISFDMDADSLIHISRPSDGHNRLYPISMGRYGPNVAIPRILDTYRRLGIKQSFFVPGWCVENYPDSVNAMLREGHEVGLHGYLHEDPTTADRQEQIYWLDRSLAAHERVTGKRPVGYRAPVYNVSAELPDLLIERDFLYDSSLMGDDIPYLMQTERGELWQIPVHWGTDDWPPFAHYDEIGYLMPVKGPSDGLAPFFEEFEAMYEAGGLWMSIWHPFLTGRLARWAVVERWLEGILQRGDVWFATLEEIALHVKSERDSGNYQPHTDNLPYYTEAQLPKAERERIT